MMDIQKEREAFEEKFNHLDLSFVDDLGYCEIETQTAWEAWQAAKAQAVQGWISVEDGLPPCDFEFCETGERVSNAVLIHSAATYGFNMGMGHVNEDGVWNVYSGEHDFMNVLMVTHWMPLPDAPQEPAND